MSYEEYDVFSREELCEMLAEYESVLHEARMMLSHTDWQDDYEPFVTARRLNDLLR